MEPNYYEGESIEAPIHYLLNDEIKKYEWSTDIQREKALEFEVKMNELINQSNLER